ncbi:MAG: tetratricopeptide repeat protein [Bacteroidota bacterium]|nr:tetratricopeptide repeat protein [Bacteroidota bacterium]
MKFLHTILKEEKKWFALLFIITMMLYGNTINNGFTIDDHYVTLNATVKKGISAAPEIFKSFYAENENNNYFEYRPLVKITFALEHTLFKGSPKASHLINILLYWLALILLYKFLKQIVSADALELACTILLFAVLPLHTEVVASLKNRDILLCFIFTFLSFLHLNKAISYEKRKYLFWAYLFSVLAFLSKIEALPFILIIPIVLIKNHGFNLKKQWITYLVLPLGFVSYQIIRYTALDGGTDHHPFYNFERPEELQYDYLFRLSVGLNCLGFYILKLVVPAKLACYYGLYTIPLGISHYFLVGVITASVSLFVFFKFLKKPEQLWIGLILFILPISLYLQVAEPVPGIVGDRFTFFSSVGYSIIITQIFKKVFVFLRSKKLISESGLVLMTITILGIYSWQTINRNSEWNNNLTLYKSDVKKWPNSIKLNILYANEIIENITKKTGLIKSEAVSEHVELAYNHMLKANQLDSTYYNSLNTLAYIDLSFYNQPQRAINWLHKAQRFDTINYEIPLNLCLAFVRLNKPDSVKKYYAKTVKLNPVIKPKLDQVVKSLN